MKYLLILHDGGSGEGARVTIYDSDAARERATWEFFPSDDARREASATLRELGTFTSECAPDVQWIDACAVDISA